MGEARGVQSSMVTSAKEQTLGLTYLSRVRSLGIGQKHAREIENPPISSLVHFHNFPECGHIPGAALLDQCRYRQIGLFSSVGHVVDVGSMSPLFMKRHICGLVKSSSGSEGKSLDAVGHRGGFTRLPTAGIVWTNAVIPHDEAKALKNVVHERPRMTSLYRWYAYETARRMRPRLTNEMIR